MLFFVARNRWYRLFRRPFDELGCVRYEHRGDVPRASLLVCWGRYYREEWEERKGMMRPRGNGVEPYMFSSGQGTLACLLANRPVGSRVRLLFLCAPHPCSHEQATLNVLTPAVGTPRVCATTDYPQTKRSGARTA